MRGEGRYVGDIALPGMAFGHVLRSPHAHARIRGIDVSRGPGGARRAGGADRADWQASGFGDLPVPGGLKRRDGSPLYRPPFPALVKDRVRWVGDYVAFVVAETIHQAVDAAELIAVDYEPLARRHLGASTRSPRRAAGASTIVQTTSASCSSKATRPRPMPPSRGPRTWSSIALVINRVTAASMEPRGSVGIYHAAEGRYTIHTTLQRAHTFREELARNVLRLPENKLRVVAGDIGGSFGMKSAVYNEVGLVLLAAKVTGRPVKWMSTRSEAFLGDAQARDNVTDAELALDRDGNFLAVRVKTIANLGAYLQVGGQTFISNIGTLAGVYRTPALHADITAVFTHTNPVRPYRGNGAAGSRLCDRAAGRSRGRSARPRSGGAAPAQHNSADRHAVPHRPHLHL